MFAIQQKCALYIRIGFMLLIVAGLGGCSGLRPAVAPIRDSAANSAGDPLAVGQTVYEAHCAECHGLEGEGQPNWRQPNADGVFPAPPHDGTGHTWHHPDAQLLEIMAQGGSMPNSQMPAYADVLSQAEMEAVLTHIKTFWGERERQYQEQVTKQVGAQ